MAMSGRLNVGWAGGALVVLLLIGAALRPGPPSERQVFAAVAPSVALISHPVTLQVFIDGEKVRDERGDIVFSATVVKSDQTGSYLVTVAHGVDLTYLEEELNGTEARLGFRVGFRADADVRDLLSMARELRSHESGRRVTFKLIWGKDMRADFQWAQVFKIPVRVILVDPHSSGMDLALLHVPTKHLPVVPFGDSRVLSAGENVLAL